MNVSRTANGLQTFSNGFNNFMLGLKLKVNQQKSFIMSCGPRHTKSKNVFIGSSPIENVLTFNYLSILLDTNGRWDRLMTQTAQKMEVDGDAIFRFTKQLGQKPIQEMLQLYKSKCLFVDTYWAGF